MMAIDKYNIRHTISPQTHILFVMPRSKKGIGRCHKSGTGNNQGRRRTTPRDNQGFNRNDCHSKSIKMSLPVIYVSLPLKNSVINQPQLSLVCQQSSSSSPNSPRDNKCLDSNHINSKRMSFRKRWYLSFPHGIIHSLIQLSCPRFVNSHPALHLTKRMSSKLLQYPVRLLLICQIPCHRRPPMMEVAIFMDAWLMCLSWHRHNDNNML